MLCCAFLAILVWTSANEGFFALLVFILLGVVYLSVLDPFFAEEATSRSSNFKILAFCAKLPSCLFQKISFLRTVIEFIFDLNTLIGERVLRWTEMTRNF